MLFVSRCRSNFPTKIRRETDSAARMSAWTLQKCLMHLYLRIICDSFITSLPDACFIARSYLNKNDLFKCKSISKKKPIMWVALFQPLTNQMLISTELRILLLHWQIWQYISNLTVPLYSMLPLLGVVHPKIQVVIISSYSYCSKLVELNRQHSKDLMWFSMLLQWSLQVKIDTKALLKLFINNFCSFVWETQRMKD